jgi:hypothetical protein
MGRSTAGAVLAELVVDVWYEHSGPSLEFGEVKVARVPYLDGEITASRIPTIRRYLRVAAMSICTCRT